MKFGTVVALAALPLLALTSTAQAQKAGDKIAVTWKDNKGDTRTDEAVVA